MWKPTAMPFSVLPTTVLTISISISTDDSATEWRQVQKDSSSWRRMVGGDRPAPTNFYFYCSHLRLFIVVQLIYFLIRTRTFTWYMYRLIILIAFKIVHEMEQSLPFGRILGQQDIILLVIPVKNPLSIDDIMILFMFCLYDSWPHTSEGDKNTLYLFFIFFYTWTLRSDISFFFKRILSQTWRSVLAR